MRDSDYSAGDRGNGTKHFFPVTRSRHWPPPVKIDVHLPDLEENLRETAQQAANAVTGFVSNTIQDLNDTLSGIIDCISGIPDITSAVVSSARRCLDRMRDMGERGVERAIEYHTVLSRILTSGQLVPVNIVQSVYDAIAGDPKINKKDPNPRLWRLANAPAYVRNGVAADPVLITGPPTPAPGKRPLVFVHGKGGDGTPEGALAAMFDIFEASAHLFTDSRGLNGDNCEIYFVSYDSDITNEADLLIRNAISAAVGGGVVTGDPVHLFLSVMWREFEQRARIVADTLLPLIMGFPTTPAQKPWFFSASLGSFVVARLAQRTVETTGESPAVSRRYLRWSSFAAAIPSQSFSPTGMFPLADRAWDTEHCQVYFSRTDLILLVAYLTATNQLAMGTTGLPGSDVGFTQFDTRDTTLTTGETHPFTIFPPGDYFQLLGPKLRSDLGKPD